MRRDTPTQSKWRLKNKCVSHSKYKIVKPPNYKRWGKTRNNFQDHHWCRTDSSQKVIIWFIPTNTPCINAQKCMLNHFHSLLTCCFPACCTLFWGFLTQFPSNPNADGVSSSNRMWWHRANQRDTGCAAALSNSKMLKLTKSLDKTPPVHKSVCDSLLWSNPPNYLTDAQLTTLLSTLWWLPTTMARPQVRLLCLSRVSLYQPPSPYTPHHPPMYLLKSHSKTLISCGDK